MIPGQDSSPLFVPLPIGQDNPMLPDRFWLMRAGDVGFDDHREVIPHPLAKLAAVQLQQRLESTDFNHNFGLDESKSGTVIGKMFGVLVARDRQGVVGYLSAFSGKMGNGNHHPGFVPPVFDSLAEDSFLNEGMRELGRISQQVRKLEEDLALHADREMDPSQPTKMEGDVLRVAELEHYTARKSQLVQLRLRRKQHSNNLQNALFGSYFFLNARKETKSLNEIFAATGFRNPPAGAGECAGPKLLQYAFTHDMTPLALIEFWWGQSPKSAHWKHLHYYPCCREKCEPILRHMVSGC